MSEQAFTPQQEFDLLLYGNTYTDKEGNRLDPVTLQRDAGPPFKPGVSLREVHDPCEQAFRLCSQIRRKYGIPDPSAADGPDRVAGLR